MKKSRNEVMVGMFVIVGFLILTVLVFFVSGVYLFRPGYKFNVMYEYVSILNKGAPIRMAGVRIGEVDKVDLVYDEVEGKTHVKVRIFIEKGTAIRENYIFSIRGTHILSEPHIEVTPKPGGAPVIKPGATMMGENPVPVEALIEQAHAITGHLEAILSSFRTAVTDPEGQDSVKKIVLNLAELTESMNKVINGNEESIRKGLVDLSSTAGSLAVILDHIESGEGTAGQLLMKDELYVELKEFVSEIKRHPWRLMKKDDGKFLGIF